LWENDDFLIVDKPAPLLIHPTRPNGEVTLLGLLQARRPHPFYALVNRLDRETSGLVMVAKTSESASRLGKMMMRRELKKTYLAIARGRVCWDRLRIEKPIGRIGVNEENPIYAKQGILHEGEPAITECWVQKRLRDTTLLRIRLETGKLHQIRVHLESVDHPVLGDKIYGVDPQIYLAMCEGRGFEEHMTVLRLNRHALHASVLEFNWNGDPIHVISPLPQDLEEFVKANSY
jgi:23S rRNA pseudouridine1911/1915/1917 synthase